MPIPLPVWLLIAATLLPLASFGLLAFYGRKLGTPLAGWAGTFFMAGSFVCGLVAMIFWINGGTDWGYTIAPINLALPWIPIGAWPGQAHPGYLDVGVYIDSLTIAMFNMITLVATVIYFFSMGYMRGDSRFPRFFTYLGLFCFSMLGLVLSSTILQIFIFWELVGLCSYLLIGFWYEKKSASNAAIKAFVTNRIGDVGFLIGFGILFYHLGNATLPDLWVALGNAGSGGAIGTFNSTLLTFTGIGLFCGAAAKSAQFPLHVWLPDAMEGPTPVSALIHAATMVAAGVYLVARIFPILTPDAKLFIAIVGCVTLTLAALIALVQSDIKQVLAFSTVSQLGYMMLALGVGSWVGGLFHLIAHAFFKALLFLCAASVIRAAGHEQEMTEYGGLFRKIPMTAISFAIGILAIAGFGYAGIGFAGYASKEMILTHAAAFGLSAAEAQKSSWYWLLFLLPVVIAYVTPLYMTRLWMLTFWGKPRNPALHEQASEEPIMWLPLAALAVISIIGGSVLGVKDYLNAAIKESTAYCHNIDANFKGFSTIWPADAPDEQVGGETDPAEKLTLTEMSVSQKLHIAGENKVHRSLSYGFAWLIGIVAGFILYFRGFSVAKTLLKIAPLRWIHTWLYHRMYFDEFYFSVFVEITRACSALAAVFDKYVVDQIVNLMAWIVRQSAVAVRNTDDFVIDGAVNGVATLTQELGAAVRTPQTGRIRMYVTVLMVTVTLGVAGAIVVVLSR